MQHFKLDFVRFGLIKRMELLFSFTFAPAVKVP